MNTDESLRCLDISKRKFSVGETAAALKFANKAIPVRLTGSAGMESTRLYTDAQVKGIKRIRAVKAKGDLYGILGLEKGCTESDIKKAYRKLALQFHPDKCGAPGTDEAFKAISHAFTVLGDADKKEHYDRYGVDMDTRAGAAAAASSRGGFRGFDGARFESELSPEDLFRMFMGGSEFPRFGGNGFRTFSNAQPSTTTPGTSTTPPTTSRHPIRFHLRRHEITQMGESRPSIKCPTTSTATCSAHPGRAVTRKSNTRG
ncbi:hypothetical protein BASA83_013235 [Batrachochytrium salamandrivorans]|nr:hypothetical protein BASA83_013235 [Batrachochytrium salamandrivorans]